MNSLVLHLDDNMCALAFWKFPLSVIFPLASPVKSGMQSCEQKHFYDKKEKNPRNCIQHNINKPLMVGKWLLEINPEASESSLDSCTVGGFLCSQLAVRGGDPSVWPPLTELWPGDVCSQEATHSETVNYTAWLLKRFSFILILVMTVFTQMKVSHLSGRMWCEFAHYI